MQNPEETYQREIDILQKLFPQKDKVMNVYRDPYHLDRIVVFTCSIKILEVRQKIVKLSFKVKLRFRFSSSEPKTEIKSKSRLSHCQKVRVKTYNFEKL